VSERERERARERARAREREEGREREGGRAGGREYVSERVYGWVGEGGRGGGECGDLKVIMPVSDRLCTSSAVTGVTFYYRVRLLDEAAHVHQQRCY
jgi:hypothetical protein